MNKRQAKKRFKKTYGIKIWRMRMPDPKKIEAQRHTRKKRRDGKC